MAEPIDVVIYVSGGVVQGVASSLANPDRTLRVFVVDFDNGCDAEEGDDTPRIDGQPCSIGRELITPNGTAEVVAEFERAGIMDIEHA